MASGVARTYLWLSPDLLLLLFDNRRWDDVRILGAIYRVVDPGKWNQHREQQVVRSNAIRHTVDALASRGDEGRGKLR